MSEARTGPKRSQLAQDRSRDTRQAIIKAALELWSERGYDRGVDETKVEEIVARAGVSKATFYFHFARKEDILLATSWLTAKVFYEDALKGLVNGGSTDDIIDDITVKLCRRMERVPALGLRRLLQAQAATKSGAPLPQDDDANHVSFRNAFAVIFLQAQQNGDVPQTLSPARLGVMFEAMLMSAIHESVYEEGELLVILRERFAVLLAGARHVSEGALSPGKERTTKTRRRAG
ncbi:TetR family transcriptional regulator [Streptomyces sp. NPDC090075]|uniref:TetR family transcriptional regulator n=1 Tax=Streptomyces sp. NPDC090075 TaxID=3365937 RepID=UPI0037F937E2